MKSIIVSKNIVSLSDFKTNASKMLYEMNTSHRPMVITQNGKAAGVLLSPADFDVLTEKANFVGAVQRGIADIQQGRVIADEDLDHAL